MITSDNGELRNKNVCLRLFNILNHTTSIEDRVKIAKWKYHNT